MGNNRRGWSRPLLPTPQDCGVCMPPGCGPRSRESLVETAAGSQLTRIHVHDAASTRRSIPRRQRRRRRCSLACSMYVSLASHRRADARGREDAWGSCGRSSKDSRKPERLSSVVWVLPRCSSWNGSCSIAHGGKVREADGYYRRKFRQLLDGWQDFSSRPVVQD